MSYDLLIIRDHKTAVSAAALSLDNVLLALARSLMYEETGDFDVHIRATSAPEARPQVLTVVSLSPDVPDDSAATGGVYPRVRLKRFRKR